MPTAYTDPVRTGKIREFHEYAMLCVRAFGAAIHMRDEPLSEPLRMAIPSTYHKDEASRKLNELAAIEAMTLDQCNAASRKHHHSLLAGIARRRRQRERERKRYESMMAKVEAWDPPTGDHVEIKNFMIKQIKDSISFDCFGGHEEAPKPMSGEEWRREMVLNLRQEIARSEKYYAEEVERVESRNAWLKRFIASLGDRKTEVV